MKGVRRGRAAAALAGGGVALWVAWAMAACSSNSDSPGGSGFTDSGSDGSKGTADAGDAGSSEAGPGFEKTFVYPQDPGPGAFYVTISGESNALNGYPFPPDNPSNDTYLPDGWQFEVQEYIVVVDDITLWSDPNKSTTDQSQHGGQIAHLSGPFVVDLHKGGKIVGQGGYPEQATPIGVIANQNDNGNAPFDTAGGTRYAFGFSTVPATYDAYDVNLDPYEMADFALMVQNGYSVFYRATVVWEGNSSASQSANVVCEQTNAGAGEDAGLLQEGDAAPTSTYVDGGYDFSQIDKLTFNAALGFSTPTNYVNCQNMTGGGMPLPGEDYARGVYASPSSSTITQVTVHMDHPFWESFAENSPVHWDNIAAQYVGSMQNPVPVRVEDFKGLGFHPWFDKTGTPLPWRVCSVPGAGWPYSPPGNGQMYFDTTGVPIDPSAPCTGPEGVDYTSSQDDCKAIRDYYDYVRHTQSTQGHLNSQGLCVIDRQFPDPGGGS